MKRFLVPTDFSTNAENALFYAIELAKREKAKLILFHALNKDSDISSTEKVKKQNEVESLLKGLCMKIEHVGGINYAFEYEEGRVLDLILEAIADKKIDLVIMGTKGESNFEKVIFGSNTANVMEKAECPVIAVPEGSGFGPIKKITYATDYHVSDIPALKKLLELALPYNAQINILHIADEKESPLEERKIMEKFKKTVEEKIDYTNISFQMMAGKNIEEELKNYLDASPADLLVMSTHHRNLWNKLFGNSLTNQMVYNNPVPLLAFHYNAQAAVKLI